MTFAGRLAIPIWSARSVGDVAEWFRQGPAKPSTWVRFPASPLCEGFLAGLLVHRAVRHDRLRQCCARDIAAREVGARHDGRCEIRSPKIGIGEIGIA